MKRYRAPILPFVALAVAAALGVACPKARTTSPPLVTASAPTESALASSSPTDGAPDSSASSSGTEAATSASSGAVEATKPPPAPTSACNEQVPQAFLIRANFIPVQTKKDEFEKSVRYRTEKYGYVKGFGKQAWNASNPDANATEATFMGIKVRMNKLVVPALSCVEVEIKRACNDPYDKPYTPMVLAGIRYINTYKGGEVTNHLYGIAIDVDPARNSCCGCVKPWKDSPLCKKKAKSIFERMEMPECWVKSFEKFGFYWLGHDVLQDTMHFEFLGDPDKIVRKI